MVTLEDVKFFGGDKTDLELLKDIEDEESMEGEEADISPDLRSELEQMIGANFGMKRKAELDALVPDAKRKKGNPEDDSDGDEDESGDDSVDAVHEEDEEDDDDEADEGDSVGEEDDEEIAPAAKDDDDEPEGPQWYFMVPSLPALTGKARKKAERSKEEIKKLSEECENVYREEVEKYTEYEKHNIQGDAKWMKQVLKNGTLSDKLAAMVMLVQQAPVYRLDTLDRLLAMAKKRSNRESLMAIQSLQELFLLHLLPVDRKLKLLKDQPLGHPEVDNRHRTLWAFEDAIKRRYAEYLRVLEAGSHNSILHYKQSVTKIMYTLLNERPEQERALLALLVNKLGDPERKLASKVAYLVSQLTKEHPRMKIVVVKEVENVLFRPNISPRAQYYAVVFLNQILLLRDESDLANELIAVYFSLFEMYVKKEETMENRIMGALLTGVNRAFPYSALEGETFDARMDMLFKVAHVSNFNTSVQALMLIFQVLSSRKSISDRFYRALYAKLCSSEVWITSKASLFLNLVYKACKADTDEDRTAAILRRLLQSCVYQRPSFVCGALFLVSEVLKLRPNLKDVAMASAGAKVVPASLVEIEGAVSKKDATSSKKKKANEPEANSDSDSEEQVEGRVLENIKLRGKDGGMAINIVFNEEEAKEAEETVEDGKGKKNTKTPLKLVAPVRKKRATSAPGGPEIGHPGKPTTPASAYDPRARDPRFAHANGPFWEMEPLRTHYHPSVVAFAKTLLEGKAIHYRGDPLQDFTLTAFLDRFVYRNPKSSSSDRGGSLMKPKPSAVAAPAVNSASFLEMKKESVPEQEQFFHKYFTQKSWLEAKRVKKYGRKVEKDEEEDVDMDLVGEEVDDDDFDEDDFGSFDGDDEDVDMGDGEISNPESDGDIDEADLEAQFGVNQEAEDGEGDDASAEDDGDDDIYAALGEDGFDDEEDSVDHEPTMAELEQHVLDDFDEAPGGEGGAGAFASADDYAHLIDMDETTGEYQAANDWLDEELTKIPSAPKRTKTARWKAQQRAKLEKVPKTSEGNQKSNKKKKGAPQAPNKAASSGSTKKKKKKSSE